MSELMREASSHIETLIATVEAQQKHIEALEAALQDADEACIELAAKHGYATGHGDTVADMIREFSAQIGE